MQTTSMQKLNKDKNKKIMGGLNMFKTMKKRIKNEKGLTLIELLAVIVILAIIAAIAIPAIGNIIENSRVKAAKADIANVVSAANLYFAENDGATEFKVGSGTGFTPTTNAAQFVSDLGSITNLTVTKSTMTVTGTGKVGATKTWSIPTGVTIKTLAVEKGDIDTDGMTVSNN